MVVALTVRAGTTTTILSIGYQSNPRIIGSLQQRTHSTTVLRVQFTASTCAHSQQSFALTLQSYIQIKDQRSEPLWCSFTIKQRGTSRTPKSTKVMEVLSRRPLHCHDSGTVEWVTLIFPIEIISQSPLKWSWELC